MTEVVRSQKLVPQSKEVFSAVPPVDTNKIWRNENDNSSAYFWDGFDWVSAHRYPANFNKRGDVRNNSYLRVGDVDCDNDSRGFIEDCEMVIDALESRTGSDRLDVSAIQGIV